MKITLSFDSQKKNKKESSQEKEKFVYTRSHYSVVLQYKQKGQDALFMNNVNLIKHAIHPLRKVVQVFPNMICLVHEKKHKLRNTS